MTNDVVDMDEMLGGRNDLLRSKLFRKKLHSRRRKLSNLKEELKWGDLAKSKNAGEKLMKTKEQIRRQKLLLEAQKNKKRLRRKGFFSR